MTDSRIQEIVAKMVEISLEHDTGSARRDLYRVSMDVSSETFRIMNLIREQEESYDSAQP